MGYEGWTWSEALNIKKLSGESQILFISAGGTGTRRQLVKLWIASVNFEKGFVRS